MNVSTNDDQLEDDDEIEYMDRVVETWAAWSYGDRKLRGAGAAMILGLKESNRLDGMLDLSDDQLTDVDREIAKLDWQQSRIVDVHYRSSEDDSMDQRYARCRTDADGYVVVLRATLQRLYNALMPQIRNWWLAGS